MARHAGVLRGFHPPSHSLHRRCWQSIGAALCLLVPAACDGEADAREDEALAVVLPRDVQEIDPRHTGDAYGHKVSRLLFASLVTIEPHTLDVVPDLAERVEIVSPTTYRVTLRRGLRFSDGSTLDARDVLATYRSVVSEAMGSRYAKTYSRIERVESPSPHEVVFHLHGPHAPFLTDLELPILRAEDEKRRVAVPGGEPPVGAGPYVLTSRERGRLSLRANEHWYAGEPLFPRVRMVVIRDDNTRALRLLAGAGDLALNAIPPLLVPLLQRAEDFDVRTAPGIGTTYLGINTTAGPLADVRVRRALAYAIDRELLVRTKLGGRARLARGWIPPGHWAYAPETRNYDHDPERARRLLEAAGVARPLRLGLRCGSDRARQSLARAIAAMLREAGVEVEIRPSEMATLISDLGKGRFELTLLQVPEVIEPHVLSWFFGSERIPEEGKIDGANRWRLRSAALDAALERGRRRHERAARREAYAEVQRLLAELLPVIPLWHEDVVAIRGRAARAFRVPRDGRYGTLAR